MDIVVQIHNFLRLFLLIFSSNTLGKIYLVLVAMLSILLL